MNQKNQNQKGKAVFSVLIDSWLRQIGISTRSPSALISRRPLVSRVSSPNPCIRLGFDTISSLCAALMNPGWDPLLRPSTQYSALDGCPLLVAEREGLTPSLPNCPKPARTSCTWRSFVTIESRKPNVGRDSGRRKKHAIVAALNFYTHGMAQVTRKLTMVL